MKKKLWVSMIVLTLLALVLSACASPAAPTEPPAVETKAPAAQPPAEEAEPPVEETEPPAEPTEPPEPQTGEVQELILATTTSTEDSGLLDYILPDFEAEYNVDVSVIAVGTGQALQLGEDGNADVLLVHARAREDEFMAAGHGVRREDVMYNDFIIVGPPSDPAGIRGMTDAAAALAKLAENEAAFISRGDESGTHTKELSVWKAAGIEPAGSWYISAGQGMNDVLTMANEQQAYTLSDRATFLARTLQGIDLEILVEGDPVLFNPYGVIAVNPEKSPNIKADLANTFIDWLVSLPVQEKIGTFGVEEFGSPLFTPDAESYRQAHGTGSDSGDEGKAREGGLAITGLVDNEMFWTEEEVRAMPTVEVEATNNQGAAETYTGVPLSELLAAAGVQDGATTIVFVGDDGYTAEVSLEELNACEDCIISFRNQGGFRSLMPGFPGSVNVRGVVEIQVK